MKTKTTKNLLLTGFFLLISTAATATHIINSQLTYQYIASTSSGVRYRLTLIMSRECGSGKVAFADDLNIGVYKREDNKRYTTIPIQLSLKNQLQDCYGYCIEEAIYQKEITLPVSSFGYYIIQEFCCRNNVKNLRTGPNNEPSQGMMAWCMIPSTYIRNSAPFLPVTNGANLLYIQSRPGMSDTVLLNPTDSDGDSLVIDFIAPFTGASLSNNYPSPPDTFPGFRKVEYASGYDASSPLGAGASLEFIPSKNAIVVNGNTEGRYAAAIRIAEYRGGVLLGYTIQDFIITIDNAVFLEKQFINLAGNFIQSSETAKLNWSVSCNTPKKQYLEKSVDNSISFHAIDSFDHTITLAEDDDITLGHTYYYRIRTMNSLKMNFFSNIYGFNYFNQGITDVQETSFSVYPIPVQQWCMLSIPGSIIKSYKVLDAAGRQILYGELSDFAMQYELDCSSLPQGMYTIAVLTSAGSTLYQKMLKL